MESDARVKENIADIPSALKTVGALRGVSYVKKTTKRPEYGLIAQEVERILPSLVSARDDTTRGINYLGIVALLVEAVKELSSEIEDIKKQRG